MFKLPIRMPANAPAWALKLSGKAARLWMRHGNDICTYGGMALGLLATVDACRQTLKLEPILDEAKQRIDDIHATRADMPDAYSESDMRKDLARAYASAAGKAVRLYIRPAGMQLTSMIMIGHSHADMKHQNANLIATCAALTDQLKEYRKRVKDDQGQDKDTEYMHGVTPDPEAPGKVVRHGETLSVYAREFCRGKNLNWTESPDLNMAFLNSKIDELNWKLKARGHMFLNEVYRALGYEESDRGQDVGWVYDGTPQSLIQLEIFEIARPADRREAWENYDQHLLLDFNVQGNIRWIFAKTFGASTAEKLVEED